MSSLIAAFDPHAARARLEGARGPVFWRSLEELAASESFQHWLRAEHPQLADTLTLDRRDFLKTLGASLALAGLGACSHPPQDQIVPYVNQPLGQIDGLPRYFATTLTRDGYAHGVLVESHMGRPTKIEGNPQHPASLGATDIFAQAAVLQLWDPDRSQTLMHWGEPATWDDFSAALVASTARFANNGGAGLHLLTRTITSPTVIAQLEAVRRKYPRAKWHVHQPAGRESAIAGSLLAFGTAHSTQLHLERAQVILALDADFLCDAGAGVRYAREFTRAPESAHARERRLYVVEATPSLTGACADHRLPLGCAQLEHLARRLARQLGVDIEAGPLDTPRHGRWLDAVTADLRSHAGASLIAVGDAQPPWMHALGHLLNAELGNAGKTVTYHDTVEAPTDNGGTLSDLTDAIRAGAVDTLWVLDANPVYDAPVDLQFDAALKQVPHLVHLGLYRDETGERAEWHLPQAHELEAWSDTRAFDGTAAIAQPLIAPLYAGRSVPELLGALLGDFAYNARAALRTSWKRELPDDAAWSAALQSGVIPDSGFPAQSPATRRDFLAHIIEQSTQSVPALEVLFRPDPTIGDGRWGNNGWLQELPKPLTQLTWDNAALISPALAATYALSNGDIINLQVRERRLRVPVWLMPGQAPDSITLHLGYGRRRAGHVGDGQGFSAYALRTAAAPWVEQGAQIHKTDHHYEFAGTQHHFNMEHRSLLRVGTLDEYLRNPKFATEGDRYPGTAPSLYSEYPPGEYAWGMSIDLDACIGCKACTIACQAENNIPVVGKDQVRRGREMHWIRVDRYYEGDANNPRTYSQPVPCMMCEHAPCELVCPVGATVHDSEGLNVQVYNRCVGTRFCSNNCPYKVRRFNFLQYIDESQDSLKAQRNPEVTVRRRGVMEKCTYCIQRIETAHIEADKAGRRIRDGEVVTACQAVCPTQAIRFGDIADTQSDVARSKRSPRNYLILGELNTRPRTSYLARVRNPNPDLEDS